MAPPYVRSIVPCLLLTGSLVGPAALSAEDSSVKLGTHVVRRGDNLEGIATYYLGSWERWPEIWELNKDQIADPHRINPGQILRIQVPEKIPTQAALVAKKNRQVEEQRDPLGFRAAEINDLLQPLDVVRTGDGASAELKYGDETSLVLTEMTSIVLGDEPAAAAPVARQQIEIEYGQADLENEPSAGSAIEIEIVMGATLVTSQPAGAAEGLRARTRRPDGKGAQLMVYSGKGDVESAGSRVAVAEGMGTTVADGEPPAPPERLLDPPRMVSPESGARLQFPNPSFEWGEVAGAESYTLEVCWDPDCGELELRLTDLDGTSWQAEPLPVAAFYWRVTARSRSGLDGYPSSPEDFTVLSDQIDQVAPRASVGFSGPKVGVGNRLVLGIGAAIEVLDVSDEGTGLKEWTRLLDGQPVAADGWKSPAWSPGPHRASVTGVDKAGNRMRFDPEDFVYDPDPPVIQWGVEDGAELGRTSGPSPSEVDPLLERKEFGLWSRTTGSNLSPLVWTSSEVKWLPMGFEERKINSDKPFILIRARKKPVTFLPVGETVTKKSGLWIHATDPGCGVESMRYQLYMGPQKQKVLVVEAVDALDNKTRVVWSLD